MDKPEVLPEQDVIERILFRRVIERRIDGYTLETAREIAEALADRISSQSRPDGELVERLTLERDAARENARLLQIARNDDTVRIKALEGQLRAALSSERIAPQGEGDRPVVLATARAWWAENMPNSHVKNVVIKGDGRVDVHWADADEEGKYTLPVNFLASLSAPTGERAQIVAWLRGKADEDRYGPNWRALRYAAHAIERGDHLASLTPSKEGE